MNIKSKGQRIQYYTVIMAFDYNKTLIKCSAIIKMCLFSSIVETQIKTELDCFDHFYDEFHGKMSIIMINAYVILTYVLVKGHNLSKS